jgi:hypothetical protein
LRREQVTKRRPLTDPFKPLDVLLHGSVRQPSVRSLDPPLPLKPALGCHEAKKGSAVNHDLALFHDRRRLRQEQFKNHTRTIQ